MTNLGHDKYIYQDFCIMTLRNKLLITCDKGNKKGNKNHGLVFIKGASSKVDYLESAAYPPVLPSRIPTPLFLFPFVFRLVNSGFSCLSPL